MEQKEIDALKQMKFEQALAELEKIVSQMENGQLPLEDMMKYYEKGQLLSSICSEKLKDIEKKVEILQQKANGEVAWTDFDPSQNQTRVNTASSTPQVQQTQVSGQTVPPVFAPPPTQQRQQPAAPEDNDDTFLF